MESLFGVFVVFLLVFINGFFVAAEFALVGARQTRLIQLAEEGHAAARVARQATHHLDNYIAATQLGITLASLGLGWVGEPAIAHLFEPLLHLLLPQDMVETVGHTIAIAIAFALVTMLHIILGELTPKSIALQRPEGTAIIIARPVTLFLNLFRPVIFMMNAVGNGVVRLLGFEPATEHSSVHSAEELEMLVKSSGEAGVLEAKEEELLRRVFDFAETSAEEIMQPRVDVESIAIDMPLHDLLAFVQARHHSRYPVYAGSVDTVAGVLHIKDLFEAVIQQPSLLMEESPAFDLKPLLITPIFAPEKLPVDRLLSRMQASKIHLAVIIDEFGGMAGIVTMEDVLEELVGEVQDEFDDSKVLPIISEDGIIMVDGLVSVSDVSERFGEPNGEYDSTTIGGFIGERLGRIPQIGDRVKFGDYDVTVDKMDGMRVARVRFIRSKAKGGAVSDDGDDS